MVMTLYGLDIWRNIRKNSDAAPHSTTQENTLLGHLKLTHIHLDYGRKLEYPTKPYKDRWRA